MWTYFWTNHDGMCIYSLLTCSMYMQGPLWIRNTIRDILSFETEVQCILQPYKFAHANLPESKEINTQSGDLCVWGDYRKHLVHILIYTMPFYEKQDVKMLLQKKYKIFVHNWI